MYDFLTSVIATIFVLGVMIVVHEFGHFAAAKLLGVRVEQFAIGFGKRIFGIKRGETDYRVNWIPLGGYVKMSGENPMEKRTGDPREFMSHPRWHRFLIAIAGPAMNVLLAIGLLTIVYMVRYQHDAYLNQAPVVGVVVSGSPAQAAGLEIGDRVIRVENQNNPTWEDVGMRMALSPGHPVNLAVQRGNQILDLNVTPKATGRDAVGDAGFGPAIPVIIGAIEPGMPAQKAGLQPGDRIEAVDGKQIASIDQFIDLLQQTQAKPVQLVVQRNNHQFTTQLAAVEKPGETRWRIGFSPEIPTVVEQLPFSRALSKSVEANKKMSYWIVETVERLVQRQVSLKQMSGPIGIGAAAGQAAREPGWTPLMRLMSMISLNLGIFNLLPIPILDGGVILLLAVEGIMRRDISQPIKERIYQAAFVFLVIFAAMVIYNDLVKTLPGLSQHLP